MELSTIGLALLTQTARKLDTMQKKKKKRKKKCPLILVNNQHRLCL